MANVKYIPATKMRHTGAPIESKTKRRVAGYARVSTDSDEQLTSYEAQVDYYTHFIRKNPDWEFVGVYTDEGISALNTRHREGFNRMIADALDGKIDLIVTKSVSRFARNTVDSLTTIRKLKDHGVEVFFEKENIWTFDGKGELLLTIMSSLAQEESRSISDNITWGQRKRFADGKVNMPFSSFLGYRRGKDGKPEIEPEEAELVRLIYKLFMGGKTITGIATYLTQQGIPTPRKKPRWRDSTVESILTNERYKGDALLQKQFTVDFLNKKMKNNEGEVPQYYVTDSHPAIIDRTEWELVQAEMAKRKEKGNHQNSLNVFSSKIYCGECGSYYGSKVWHSTDKYRRVVWRCNGKYERQTRCSTPHLTNDEIKRLFLSAISKLHEERETLLEDCRYMRGILADTTELEAERARLMEELTAVGLLTEKLFEENAAGNMTTEEFDRRHASYAERYNDLQEKLSAIADSVERKQRQIKVLDRFIKDLRGMKALPIDFSDRLWNALVEKLTIYPDGRAEFLFKNGTTVTERLLTPGSERTTLRAFSMPQ